MTCSKPAWRGENSIRSKGSASRSSSSRSSSRHVRSSKFKRPQCKLPFANHDLLRTATSSSSASSSPPSPPSSLECGKRDDGSILRGPPSDFSLSAQFSRRSSSRSIDPHEPTDFLSSSSGTFPPSPRRRCSDLPLEWWERGEGCKIAKAAHMKRIDRLCDSREMLVLFTTLWKKDIALEPNMFPYNTPPGILHYTLWSIHELNHHQVVSFVDRWLETRMPHVRRWQYDDNSGDRSILLFHVHVYIETKPYSFTPQPGLEYFPPHCQP